VLKGRRDATLEAAVPVVAGENLFTAYAFNRDNVKSADAELTVTGADSLKHEGTAYVLAVGVNAYENAQYDLKYAEAIKDPEKRGVQRPRAFYRREPEGARAVVARTQASPQVE
jgi:hypothetical protein